MRLELGRRADYAIRAAVHLARRHGQEQRHKAREIAEAMSIPASYVPQILAELVRAGVVSSVAGRDGGYRLARDPAEISLLEIIRALDGQLQSSECVLRGGPCHWDEMCAVHVPWVRAQHAMLDELGHTTLADVGEIDQALQAGTFDPPSELRRRVDSV